MLREMKSVIALKDYFFCILSASLLIFSFPNFNVWLFAWFGFVPLFFVLQNKSKSKAFWLSYLTGIIFWFGIINWLVHVTLTGLIVLVLYLALYFSIFGLLVSAYSLKLRAYSLLLTPSIWVLLEYVRSHFLTGFPWALLGYSQYLNLPIIQIADITGVWGVSFLVMLVNVAVYSVVSRKLSVISAIKKHMAVILCIIFTLTYGYFRINNLQLKAYSLKLKVSVIQGNIPQELKWQPSARDNILNRYTQLTERAARDNPHLIVWPEASSPGVFGEDDRAYEHILKLSEKIKTPLLVGAVVREDEKYFNSAVLISSLNAIAGRYDKLHLVPFGEYIPLKKILPFLETIVPIGDITRGGKFTIFRITAGRSGALYNFAVLICFEDLFPELSRQFTKKGADFLINITNDAWYKETSAPYQHLQASVFRAVENRLYLVRAANTGVSGFIAPEGKITSLVQDKEGRRIFIEGYKTQEFPIYKPHLTFYARYGDIFIAGCFLLLLYGIILPFKKKR